MMYSEVVEVVEVSVARCDRRDQNYSLSRSSLVTMVVDKCRWFR